MKFIFVIALIFANYASVSQNTHGVERLLAETYTVSISSAEEWIFKADSANLEKLERPVLAKYFPNCEFYLVNLTWKTRPDWICTCLVFYDTLKDNFILQPPLSMADIDLRLVNMLKQIHFTTSKKLRNFIREFHLLRQIGSKYKFFLTNDIEPLMRFETVYFADQNFITQPYQETKSLTYDKNQITGVFYIRISGNQIIDYKELAPNERGFFSALCR